MAVVHLDLAQLVALFEEHDQVLGVASHHAVDYVVSLRGLSVFTLAFRADNNLAGEVLDDFRIFFELGAVSVPDHHAILGQCFLLNLTPQGCVGLVRHPHRQLL